MPSVPFLVIIALVVTVTTVHGSDAFERQTHTGKNGNQLPYRLLSPARVDSDKRYPVVIFLHGAGERGDDNQKQLKLGVQHFATAEIRQKFPCFVIAPQCPKGKRWCEVDWGDPKPHKTPENPSQPMELLLELIDAFRQRPAVDSDRLYIIGLSMGGFGTWDLVTRRPSLFAAAIPVCGGADVSAAPTLSKLPIWVFHGAKDTVVKTVRSQLMVEALKKAGSTVIKYSEYPGVGHDAWTPAFKEPELLTWLFAQRRAN